MRILGKKTAAILIFTVLSFLSVAAQKANLRSLTISTEPNAIVWINDVNYGKTDASGKLLVKTFATGAHKIRVRANGFKEISQNLPAAQTGELKIALIKTTDEAELTFQKAEETAALDREKSVELYQKAVKLRPKYAEAYLGLARVLAGAGDTAGALKAVQNARRARLNYAEAAAVEGRIYKDEGNEEKAVAAFKRAISEGKGFQPEAHTGLGLFYKEKAEGFGAGGDFESEKANYLLAAKSLNTAISQLAGAPDVYVVYQLLGDSYERAKMYKEAITVYQQFIRDFPDAEEAETMRSFIVQLEKRIKEEQ